MLHGEPCGEWVVPLHISYSFFYLSRNLYALTSIIAVDTQVMPVGFGFSVGDFIAGVGLLTKSYRASRATKGASDEYQRDIEWLEQLVSTLQKLSDEAGDEAPQLSESCKRPLAQYAASVKAKYENYIGAGSRSKKPLRAYKSIRWTFSHDAAAGLAKLRAAVVPHLQNLELELGRQERYDNLIPSDIVV